jgi:hypothetical protein
MTAIADPVEAYDQYLTNVNSCVRRYAPFTYMAYRSLIPEKENDWYWLASKTAWVIFVMRQTSLTMPFLSWVFCVSPFLPFIFDAIWIGVRWLCPSGDQQVSSFIRIILTISIVAFNAIGVLSLLSKGVDWVL